MDSPELKDRCKSFALRIINLVRALPKDRVANPIANQIIRSGTSTAANYRAARIAKSRADFISKLDTSVEEAEEQLSGSNSSSSARSSLPTRWRLYSQRRTNWSPSSSPPSKQSAAIQTAEQVAHCSFSIVHFSFQFP